MRCVRRSEFPTVVAKLAAHKGVAALDTETTGLNAYAGDRLFSVIVATGEAEAYYFNFQSYRDIDPEWTLPRDWLAELGRVLSSTAITWFMHNAKFDLGMLAADGLHVAGDVHCTEAIGRVVYNRHMTYTLAARAADAGCEKSGAVDAFIKEYGLKSFAEVPFDIIVPYGLQDAVATYKLGMWQLAQLKEAEATTPAGLNTPWQVVENERALTKVCFAMEQRGTRVDVAYSLEALAHEQGRAAKAAADFERLSGHAFVDSGKALAVAFTAAGEKYPVTEKGNPSFTDDVLAEFTTPLAACVREYREASKKAGTYYKNFIDYADADGFIHANIRQGGTATGRFSYAEPNLQNVPKEEDGAYKVRRAFVPPTPDHCLVMIDYNQMEYRLLLNYSRDMGVIEKVLAGMDVHQATGDDMGVSRTVAKKLNFMLLYGGGAGKLATSLGVPLHEAPAMKSKYFDSLPGIRDFTRQCQRKAELTGYVTNWAGRRCHFPPLGPKQDRGAFRAANHVIQGGCADVIKLAMPRIDKLLAPTRSKMLIQVHDELLFAFHREEFALIPLARQIMETAFRPAGNFRVLLPLTCSVEHSWQSWADKVKGLPT